MEYFFSINFIPILITVNIVIMLTYSGVELKVSELAFFSGLIFVVKVA
jgi:hypothetical protein